MENLPFQLLFKVTYLRAPLKRQATNNPARPGRPLKTSITKYSTICPKKPNVRTHLDTGSKFITLWGNGGGAA